MGQDNHSSEYRYMTDAAPVHKNCKYTGDYIGMRFGQLVVIGYPSKHGMRMGGAFCRCDCGNIHVVPTIGSLLNGSITRCTRCGYKAIGEAIKKRYAEHPERRYRRGVKPNPYKGERLYHVWMGMKQRCNDRTSYCKDVEVCSEWLDYPVFREWAYSHGYDENAPRGECTIDRINPFGDYEPSNCRWVDMKTQAQNKRKRWLRMSEAEREKALAQARS